MYSFHREESKKTRQLSAMIDMLHCEPTEISEKRINIFTLIWALLKDDNYLLLLQSKTSMLLKKMLQKDAVILIRGKGRQIYLNLDNYIQLKTKLNQFYKYLLSLSAFYVQNRMFINKEKILKDLKNKDVSFPFLLRQDHFVFQLQRLMGLPKTMIKGSFETDRIPISFEDKKNLDEFILFLTTDIADHKQAVKSFQQNVSAFASFIKRRKEVAVSILLISLVSALLAVPLFSGHLAVHLVPSSATDQYSSTVSIPYLSFDTINHRVVYSIHNTTQEILILRGISITFEGMEKQIVSLQDTLSPHEVRSYDLQNVALIKGARLIIDVQRLDGTELSMDLVL
jgi:hypothetical protein